MKIYISGPMTGMPDFNFPAFYRAEEEVKALGWKVVNPARRFGGDQTRPRADYMRADIHDLMRVDAIYMLRGWKESKGAALEHAIAEELDLGLHYQGGNPKDEKPTVLSEAYALINGPRQAAYGHPRDDFARTGRMWGAILKREDIRPETVGLMMCALKISREVNKHSRDNIVDLAGYAGTIEKILG